VKILLDASPEARAARRTAQLRAAGEAAPDEKKVLLEILDRDKRDRQRATAPMIQGDAALLDTTSMDIDAAFEAARGLVDAALARKRS
jgi:cytidylate kinase